MHRLQTGFSSVHLTRRCLQVLHPLLRPGTPTIVVGHLDLPLIARVIGDDDCVARILLTNLAHERTSLDLCLYARPFSDRVVCFWEVSRTSPLQR